jgi:hypothetical protein
MSGALNLRAFGGRARLLCLWLRNDFHILWVGEFGGGLIWFLRQILVAPIADNDVAVATNFQGEIRPTAWRPDRP